MRGAGAYKLYERRMLGQIRGQKRNHVLLSPDFVTYLAQTAFELAKHFAHLKGFNGRDFTPTGGLTGILMALNLCSAIDLYGFHVSQAHGVPYHYHNRCPQPCESALRWSARLVDGVDGE